MSAGENYVFYKCFSHMVKLESFSEKTMTVYLRIMREIQLWDK